MGDVEGVAVEGGEGWAQGNVAENLGDDGVAGRIDDHGAGEDPTVGEGLELCAPEGRGPEEVVEVVVVVCFDVRGVLSGDPPLGEIVYERFEESVDLV